MFRESGQSEDVLGLMAIPFRDWLEPRLADGRYFGWALEQDGAEFAGLGMMEIDWPPHPSHPQSNKRGYILNVYVEPDFRGRGFAKRLMAEAVSEARKRRLQFIILHATKQARPLYEGLGWQYTSEMALTRA